MTDPLAVGAAVAVFVMVAVALAVAFWAFFSTGGHHRQ